MKDNLRYQSTKKKRIIYTTPERLKNINQESVKIYEKYLRTSISKNRDVANTTYKVYKSNFNIFLCYVLEHWDNQYILDEKFLEEDILDCMDEYIVFLQMDLQNNKKTINNKIAAVSSFYIWAAKKRMIRQHPFAGMIDRMKGAQDEKIVATYFLNDEEVQAINAELDKVDISGGSDYDKQDQLIWNIAFDSACRIAALHGLTLSKLDLEKNRFVNIREKRGKIVSIPFTESTKKKLLEFIEQRKEIGVTCDELFYVHSKGEWRGMSTQSIYNRIVQMGYIVGVGDFRPHCIRKTRLDQVKKVSGLEVASKLANHESLDTTRRFYTQQEDQSEILDEITKAMQQD